MTSIYLRRPGCVLRFSVVEETGEGMLPKITQLLGCRACADPKPTLCPLDRCFCLSPALCAEAALGTFRQGVGAVTTVYCLSSGGCGGGQDRGWSQLRTPTSPGLFWRRQADDESKVNILKAAVEGEAPGKAVVGGSFCGVSVSNLFRKVGFFTPWVLWEW